MKNFLTRRRTLQLIGLSTLGFGNWRPALADHMATDPQRRRQCILLWMSGGPSQIDTFDMKPDHENGGEFKEVATIVPGLRFSEHLPRLALQADKLAIIRSLSTKEGDHDRASYLVRTGERPLSPVNYPSIAASLGKELSKSGDTLPPYVSIAPSNGAARGGFGSGFLGAKYGPVIVGGGMTSAAPIATAAGTSFAELKINSIDRPADVSASQAERRLAIWKSLESEFLTSHPTSSVESHRATYDNALHMIQSEAPEAFDLAKEAPLVREAYGRGFFGQGCLLARRLIERGVPLVEVSLSSSSAGAFAWDTHANNFEAVKALSAELDAGWSALMTDLSDRGLLQNTTIAWMGEFGRTPRINRQAGRDHFPRAWSCVLAGGGIAGGQAYGATSKDGSAIEADAVGVQDVIATLCSAVGVNPAQENTSNTGRPVKLVNGTPIQKLLA